MKRYPKSVSEDVCRFYSKHGGKKTVEEFPGVNVPSIIEYYFKNSGFSPRQARWTGQQKIELAKMQGIVPHSLQAKFFKRPGASAGSIVSFWEKSLGRSYLNGLPWETATPLVRPSICKRFTIKTKAKGFGSNGKFARRIIVWGDLLKGLRAEVPTHIREAIEAMAKFQQWLHGVKNVRLRVRKLTSASTPGELSKLLKG